VGTRRHLNALPAALLLASGLAHAVRPPSSTATFSPNSSLSFGRFAAGSAGTVTVSPDGARNSTGGVVLLTSTASAASFTFIDTANPTSSCFIKLPADGQVVLTSGNGGQLYVNKFTSNPSINATMQGGNLQFSVGATLVVGASQASGTYSGSMPITVEYQ
jgi:hypothetical protein